MPLADYQNLVDKMVRAPDGTATISTADRDQAIDLARMRYSVDVERELVADITWTADGYFADLPEGWAAGCYIKSAEFPIGEQPPQLIGLAIYGTPTEQRLAAEEALEAGAVVRLTYGAPHELTDGPPAADTIAVAHREAVASYAASILCGQLAAHFSGQRETSINADSSDTDARSRNYAARAKDYRSAYFAGIGKADPRADKGGGSGGDAAASTSAWAGRQRTNFAAGSLL